MASPFHPIAEALEAVRAGRMVVVVDDEDRENEGDFIMPAEAVTPEAINFMARYGRGLICAPLSGPRLDALGLGPMTVDNTSIMGTPFTLSVDARHGTSTGSSAFDRARTVRALLDPATTREDLAVPGHIFPLRAHVDGVLGRPGHTEATVDLALLAGFSPAGVLCEIMDEDGAMARLPRLVEMAREHGMPIISIADLIAYRKRLIAESLHPVAPASPAPPCATEVAHTTIPTSYGEFALHLFTAYAGTRGGGNGNGSHPSAKEGEPHVALVLGHPEIREAPLVRVHSQCLTGDVFGSLRCDCGAQLAESLRRIAAEGAGVVIYLRQEGREIGLANKIRAYHLQDSGLDTVEANEALGLPADPRDYTVAGLILRALGIDGVRLLTNNPRKIEGLERTGIRVAERVPLEIEPNERNRRYLEAKRDKLGHWLEWIAGRTVPEGTGDWRDRPGSATIRGSGSRRG